VYLNPFLVKVVSNFFILSVYKEPGFEASSKPGPCFITQLLARVADLSEPAVVVANAVKALANNSRVRTINKPKELIASCVQVVLNDAGLNILRRIGWNVKISNLFETHGGDVCVFHNAFNNI